MCKESAYSARHHLNGSAGFFLSRTARCHHVGICGPSFFQRFSRRHTACAWENNARMTSYSMAVVSDSMSANITGVWYQWNDTCKMYLVPPTSMNAHEQLLKKAQKIGLFFFCHSLLGNECHEEDLNGARVFPCRTHKDNAPCMQKNRTSSERRKNKNENYLFI